MELSDKGAGGTERLIVRGILLSYVGDGRVLFLRVWGRMNRRNSSGSVSVLKCQQEKHRVGDDFGGCLVILSSGKSALFKIGTLSERSEFVPILNAFSRFSQT